MFGLTTLIIAASVAAVIYLVADWRFGGDAKAEKRKQAAKTGRVARVDQDQQRKKSVATTLKALEDRHKTKVSLSGRIEQAGLGWSKFQFFLFSGALAFGVWFLLLLITVSFSFSLLGLLIGGLGLPNWFLSYRMKQRLNKFIEAFPGALDIITRGVKAGLPMNECLKIIGNECADPLGAEFRLLVEAQQMGLTLPEASQRLAERTPCSESQFFAIALGIQQKSGGNISETLANLARVLRERKKMKMKIKAMSTEATASAAIIACMPPGVAVMVYFSSPDYIALLWTTSTGQVTLVVSAIWMGLGVLTMKRMINFEV